MRISLEWLSDHVRLPADATPRELAHELTLRTVEVEDVLTIDGDVIFEIDNKSLTNRPDLWSHHGIAREFAAIYRLPLTPSVTAPRPPTVTGLVDRIDPALCRRLAVVEFTVEPGTPTPGWIRERLARLGVSSGGLLVDLSNYVMFTVGQPTHVHDADRTVLPLSATLSPDDTRLELLDGRETELPGPVPLIRDATGPVAVAGVLGGARTAVRPDSRRFLLEAATFRPAPVRRVSQRSGLRTEASVRFEKALDTQRVDQAVYLFLHLLREAAPTASVTAMQDVDPAPTTGRAIPVSRAFLDRRIGQRIDDGELSGTLQALGFTVRLDGETLEATAPTWRSTGDVALPHDVLEEVARIHGYDRLPIERIPIRLQPVRALHRRPVERAVSEVLATRANLREVLTYPWTSHALLGATGHPLDRTVRIEGAPAPDRDSLRPSLIPNLLEAVAVNLPATTPFGIFEVGTVFPGGEPTAYHGTYETMPPTLKQLGVVLAGTDGEELFRRLKGVLEMLRRHAHLTDLSLNGDPDVAWADPSARLALFSAGRPVGALGLLTPRARRLAGLGTSQVACAEVDLSGLAVHASRDNRFTAVPDLPEAEFDLSVLVDDDVSWARVEAVARKADELVRAVSYVGTYRGTWVPQGQRSLSLRITLRPQDRTLTADTIGAVRGRVIDLLGAELKAYLRQA
ncbi:MULTISPECIES: phenylalanine--tRNA ligase subunit beta [unclassified Micromonospora]|uniref:phenylalanine--tRNA ligase subunit beta n=1 Tax=unclassified Micromonospora TaxID=2617518 RepID=UPI001C229A27|nr:MULTISPECIES: phenylalanine--tRNA ligase subunit beta [unclassified Micromonospora]MBU8858625.1 phenylalanine--tRNA ligase subunit beta [Micromonospora sp. WMMB482]MDM4784269.1 phenylalanine--tRNA ligase subunit beta [Micromonospora sp. b486]